MAASGWGATIMLMHRLALLCALLPAAGAQAEVYKWVDKDGHVKYGDHPPADDPAARQVNASNVPVALQDRLKSLDGGYGVLNMCIGLANVSPTPSISVLAHGWAEAMLLVVLGFLTGMVAVIANWAVESRIDRAVLRS